jgi:hypothetical protein
MTYPVTATMPPSLRWTVDQDLDQHARRLLIDRLDAVVTDRNAPLPGWNRLAPDVVVLVAPHQSGFRVVAHWTEPPKGLPTTTPAWVEAQVGAVLHALTGQPPAQPELVPVGPDAAA